MDLAEAGVAGIKLIRTTNLGKLPLCRKSASRFDRSGNAMPCGHPALPAPFADVNKSASPHKSKQNRILQLRRLPDSSRCAAAAANSTIPPLR